VTSLLTLRQRYTALLGTTSSGERSFRTSQQRLPKC